MSDVQNLGKNGNGDTVWDVNMTKEAENPYTYLNGKVIEELEKNSPGLDFYPSQGNLLPEPYITQIVAMTGGNSENVKGLGSDGKVYKWNRETTEWDLDRYSKKTAIDTAVNAGDRDNFNRLIHKTMSDNRKEDFPETK